MLTKKVFLMGLMTLLVFAAGSISDHFAQSNPAADKVMGVLDFSGSYDGEFSGTTPGLLTAILAQDEDQLTGYIAIDFSTGALRLSRLEATVEGGEFAGEALALDGSGRTVLVGELDQESKAITGYFLASTGEVADFYIMDKLEAQEPLDLNGRYAGRGYNAPDGAQFTLTIDMQHAEASLTGSVAAQTPLGPLTGTLRATLDNDRLRDQVTTLATPVGPVAVMSPNSFVTSDGNIIMSDINAGEPIPLRGSFIVRRQ